MSGDLGQTRQVFKAKRGALPNFGSSVSVAWWAMLMSVRGAVGLARAAVVGGVAVLKGFVSCVVMIINGVVAFVAYRRHGDLVRRRARRIRPGGGG